MTTDPQVIAELRDLFRGGAAPSRLVRHIVARHGEGPQLDRLVRAYFREAFGVPMFRASADLLTLPAEELPFAGVNAAVIHQIVARRAVWDDSPGGMSWMDGLTATDDGSQPLHEQVAILSRLVEQLQGQVVALQSGGEHGLPPTKQLRLGAVEAA